MIEFKKGDIFEENVEALVNTVNCVGVMGRGIALQFKKKFPDNFKAYAKVCKRNELVPGQMFVFKTQRLMNPRYVINFPTKRHWRGKSRLEDIDAGLDALVVVLKKYKIRSVGVPPLGSGLGGLDWNTVKGMIQQKLGYLADVHVTVLEPMGAPAADKMARTGKPPGMTPGRAALVILMHRYLGGLLDPFVSLLELHKLMYFMQEAGEPLRLDFQKAVYGPYAENLRHVLNIVEGYLVSGYADGGDAPNKQLALVPGAYREAVDFIKSHPETMARFERLSQLVDGFESPFGLELLSSVHWVACREHAVSVQDVVTKIHSWNSRKRKFTARQIDLAYTVLSDKGWTACCKGC